jgi:hypothetical protein
MEQPIRIAACFYIKARPHEEQAFFSGPVDRNPGVKENLYGLRFAYRLFCIFSVANRKSPRKDCIHQFGKSHRLFSPFSVPSAKRCFIRNGLKQGLFGNQQGYVSPAVL